MADVVNQVQGTVFRPKDTKAVDASMQAVQQGGQQALAGVNQASQQLGGINSGFSQLFNPQAFNTNFQTQGGLDGRSQALFNQFNAQNQAGASAQQRQLQRSLGGRNAGLAQVLGQQGQQQAMLASQPAFFQAGQQQEARLQQERQLQNQAMLQSTQQQAALQGQGNDTRLQAASTQANLSNLLAQIPQSTLASLFGAAQGMGQQYASTPEQLAGTLGQINATNNPGSVASIREQQLKRTQDRLRFAQQFGW
jgi:hypothetical protein